MYSKNIYIGSTNLAQNAFDTSEISNGASFDQLETVTILFEVIH